MKRTARRVSTLALMAGSEHPSPGDQELSVVDKARLTTGADLWSTNEEPRIGLPSLRMSDGPNGVRGNTFDERVSAWCTPCGTALGASWDDELVMAVGGLLGEEAQRMNVDVLLGPTVNLHRSPLGGRGFECFSEDPVLSGRMAAAWVSGVQGCGVAASPKHIVGNDSETSRTTIDCVIDERALRELYLVPFEYAARAGAWTMMAAYNRVNGEFATENRDLLHAVVKQEWGWDGLIVSDWLAARNTVRCALSGLDLEMPAGPVFGEALAAAVQDGRVPEWQLDDKVERLRRLAGRVRSAKTPSHLPSATADDRARDANRHSELLTRAAAAGFVLLKNHDDLLPLDDELHRGLLAVIGPNIADPCFQGGGAAAVNMGYVKAPLEVLRARYPHVEHEVGCVPRDSFRPLELLGVRTVTPYSTPGVTVEYFPDVAGAPPTSEDRRTSFLSWYDGIAAFQPSSGGRVRLSAWLTVERSGTYEFSVRGSGSTSVAVAGVQVAGLERQARENDMFAAVYSDELGHGGLHLAAGVPVLVEAWMEHVPTGIPVFEVGARAPVPDDLRKRAVALAQRADAVLVVVGTSADVESESKDRTTTSLPGEQNALVEAILQVNPRTVVVVNAGAAVDLPWVAQARSVLYTWFPGHGFADALAAVVSGEMEPGGRLPITLAAGPHQYSAYDTSPDADGKLIYAESVDVGYRHFDRMGLQPAFPFGHGSGYTRFELTDVRLSTARLPPGGGVAVTVDVCNVGSRAGKHVVQLYVSAPPASAPATSASASVLKPTPPLDPPLPLDPHSAPNELKAFQAVHLGPGESRKVTMQLGPRAFAHWDVGLHRWRTGPGRYRIKVGSSSRDLMDAGLVTVARFVDVTGSL